MPQRFAIHQPNFFPWLGYFDRIQKVDTFIFFDHVAMPGGRTIVQRVKVAGPKEPVWLTFPVEKSGNFGQRICEARIRNPQESFQAALDKLQNYYRRSPHYREVLAFLKTLSPQTDLLAAFNQSIIETISRKLGFTTRFVASSSSPQLMASGAIKTDMIVETCQAFGATDYISGRGCLEFLETELFEEEGITLSFQEFEHPTYRQATEPFVAGLSILDALFNLGFEGTSDALMQPQLALSGVHGDSN